jgi:membrane-bound lytic murein transglycosylase D
VIHPGDVLSIPNAAGSAATLAAVAAPREDISAQLPEHQKGGRSKATRSSSYTVQSGDTLWGIAHKYGVTVPQLADANGLATTNSLAPGTRLQIPGGSKSASDANRMTYKVKRGDTLSEIADKFNVSVRELMTWNRLRESSSLRTGQRLVVYVDAGRQTGG